MPRSKAWTSIGWWIMPIVCGLLLASPSVTLPRHDFGIRRFQTPPLGPSVRLAQMFRMPADGLHAIEVFPVATGARVSGDIRFELYELYEVGSDRYDTLVRSSEVLAEDVVRAPSYSFEFAPILDSKDRAYRLDLVASPADGVAFWATRGPRYENGGLSANGRARWADLAFRVHAPAPSVWARLMTLRGTNPVRAYVVMGSFVAIWFLIALVVRTLMTLSLEARQSVHQ